MDNNQNNNQNQEQNQNNGEQRNYQTYQQNMQNGYQQTPPYYQQAPYSQMQQPFAPETEPPMKISEWIMILILQMIPCVNIIMLFVWAFDSTPGKKSRANYCKAMLILMCIIFVLYILLAVVLALLGGSVLEGLFSSISGGDFMFR